MQGTARDMPSQGTDLLEATNRFHHMILFLPSYVGALQALHKDGYSRLIMESSSTGAQLMGTCRTAGRKGASLVDASGA